MQIVFLVSCFHVRFPVGESVRGIFFAGWFYFELVISVTFASPFLATDRIF
jgi:hypothetical protein